MLLSTDRVKADDRTSALHGLVRWAPGRSLWMLGMTAAAMIFGPIYVTPSAVLLFLVSSAITLCLGHSIGVHRLLIHRSFEAEPWVERVLIYLGTLVGMAGPIGMVRLHDMRDWAQRQAECHDFHAHRAALPRDAWWQMHCRLDLATPPRIELEPTIAQSRYLWFLERSWMAQQLPWALLFWAIGGLPWLVWGVPVRVAIGVTGHWLVGHITHRHGRHNWRIAGAGVQGYDLPIAAWLTFGEAWHGNHHAWPGSAKLGLMPGQRDPGWWMLLLMRRLGLVHDLRLPEHLEPRPGLTAVIGPPENRLRPTGA